MASSPGFTNYICEQLEGIGAIRSRKMFGEYIIYANDKPVVLVCDDVVYIKMLPCLEELLSDCPTGLPYEDAKEHYVLDPEDRDTLQRAASPAEAVTPVPQKRAPKKKYRKRRHTMTREEARQILEATFAKAFEENPEAGAKAINSYNKLKVSEYQECGKTSGNLRAVAMERLHELPVMSAEQNGEVITMMVGSGFGDRNPTMLEVVIRGSDVTVTAWAKEGIIPQKSAKKAVNAALKALGLL